MPISSRSLLLLIIAIVIAAFTAMSVRNRLSQTSVETVQPAVSNRVLVAKKDIPAGSFVQGAQDLDWQPMDTGDMKEGYLREGAARPEDFNGSVARRSLKVGDPVLQSTLMKSGDGGFLSAVLEPGKRAMAVGVTAISGNGGFISPGDHIDLIVTHHVRVAETKDTNNEESIVSETFVHNVRVVAVDQQLDNPENKAILAKTLTVEVSPRQAEQISVAAEMGKISVALRSLTAPGDKPGDKTPVVTGDAKAAALNDLYGGDYTRDSDVSGLLDRKGPLLPHVRVIRGEQIENLEFYRNGQ